MFSPVHCCFYHLILAQVPGGKNGGILWAPRQSVLETCVQEMISPPVSELTEHSLPSWDQHAQVHTRNTKLCSCYSTFTVGSKSLRPPSNWRNSFFLCLCSSQLHSLQAPLPYVFPIKQWLLVMKIRGIFFTWKIEESVAGTSCSDTSIRLLLRTFVTAFHCVISASKIIVCRA